MNDREAIRTKALELALATKPWPTVNDFIYAASKIEAYIRDGYPDPAHAAAAE